MKYNTGQISLAWLIGIFATMATASLSAVYAAGIRTDAKVDAKVGQFQVADREVVQRVSVIEEGLKNMREDQQEIKSDVKLLLKMVK